MISEYLRQIYSVENIKGYFHRIRYYLLFVTIIFIISIVV